MQVRFFQKLLEGSSIGVKKSCSNTVYLSSILVINQLASKYHFKCLISFRRIFSGFKFRQCCRILWKFYRPVVTSLLMQIFLITCSHKCCQIQYAQAHHLALNVKVKISLNVLNSISLVSTSDLKDLCVLTYKYISLKLTKTLIWWLAYN